MKNIHWRRPAGFGRGGGRRRRLFGATSRALAGVAVLLLLALGSGCGPDRGDRGLQPTNESAVPNSPKERAETQSERKAGTVDQMQEQEIQEFDKSEREDQTAPQQ